MGIYSVTTIMLNIYTETSYTGQQSDTNPPRQLVVTVKVSTDICPLQVGCCKTQNVEWNE